MGSGHDPQESKLLAQVRETDAALKAAHLVYMVVGGVAVNAHGVMRATVDLDLTVRVEDSDALDEILGKLGYKALDRRADLAHYARPDGARLDVLYSRREITATLFEHPDIARYSNLEIPIVSVEGLIGLKVQSFSDDPRRIRDLEDIMRLMKTNRDKLDMAEVAGILISSNAASSSMTSSEPLADLALNAIRSVPAGTFFASSDAEAHDAEAARRLSLGQRLEVLDALMLRAEQLRIAA